MLWKSDKLTGDPGYIVIIHMMMYDTITSLKNEKTLIRRKNMADLEVFIPERGFTPIAVENLVRFFPAGETTIRMYRDDGIPLTGKFGCNRDEQGKVHLWILPSSN